MTVPVELPHGASSTDGLLYRELAVRLGLLQADSLAQIFTGRGCARDGTQGQEHEQ